RAEYRHLRLDTLFNYPLSLTDRTWAQVRSEDVLPLLPPGRALGECAGRRRLLNLCCLGIVERFPGVLACLGTCSHLFTSLLCKLEHTWLRPLPVFKQILTQLAMILWGL